MTNREFVSQLTIILKSANKDNRIPKRTILKAGRDAVKFLVSQKLLDRTITSESNLYTYIPCFEFEKIEAKKCPSIEFRTCRTLMKSVKPLPELIFSRLGSSIKDIVSLDGLYTFDFVDEQQYRRNRKRQQNLKNNIFIYLGTDNHLYIPDREILSLDLTVLTLDADSEEDCSACSDTDTSCKNKWDSKFVCPDKLVEEVKNITLQRLGITKQIQADQNPNNVEGV